MNHWLMKSEPSTFGIHDLERAARQTTHWDGVRNYQARNFMCEMRLGDLAFFYHSNCPEPAIVGIMEVAREAYPDFTAFDRHDPHYDAKSDPDNPRWQMVDVRFIRRLRRPVTLQELKGSPELADLTLLRRGSRLSVMPVTEKQWRLILAKEGAHHARRAGGNHD